MYDTQYNRKIAKEIDRLNKDYIKHSQGLEGGRKGKDKSTITKKFTYVIIVKAVVLVVVVSVVVVSVVVVSVVVVSVVVVSVVLV